MRWGAKIFLLMKRSNPITIWNASQQPIAGVGRYYTKPTGLEIGNHSEALVWEVGLIEDSIDRYLPVALLRKHNPDVNWETRQVKWRSPYCIKNCLPKQVHAINYFHGFDFWNISWIPSTGFGIWHRGRLSRDQFFARSLLVPLDFAYLHSSLSCLLLLIGNSPHPLSRGISSYLWG